MSRHHIYLAIMQSNHLFNFEPLELTLQYKVVEVASLLILLRRADFNFNLFICSLKFERKCTFRNEYEIYVDLVCKVEYTISSDAQKTQKLRCLSEVRERQILTLSLVVLQSG